MSKLDDILEGRVTPNGRILHVREPLCVVPPQMKEQLKDLMLELIGEDETTVPNSYKEGYKMDARIALRAELRARVEAL